jgi:hypothetical protein
LPSENSVDLGTLLMAMAGGGFCHDCQTLLLTLATVFGTISPSGKDLPSNIVLLVAVNAQSGTRDRDVAPQEFTLSTRRTG